MINQMVTIANMVVSSFIQMWPYLLVTIPLSVAVQLAGADRYINRALGSRPLIAIVLGTVVGAFSPFCSCSVIPVIAALLIGGVPLAPVMSFWIASPSMDPEIFFLSVSALGWDLAIWRLGSTLILSLAAGFVTHCVTQRGWLGERIVRSQEIPSVKDRWVMVKRGLSFILNVINSIKERLTVLVPYQRAAVMKLGSHAQMACCAAIASVDNAQVPGPVPCPEAGCDSTEEEIAKCGCSSSPTSFVRRLFTETWKATLMVAKFMALSFLLKALITLYVPSEWIVGLLGRQNSYSILAATLIGIPMYTSNVATLPMISSLLAMGMSPGAALAFLIAGPTTTLPAMAAVWGITNRRVFGLYLSFSLIGALFFGYLYGIVAGF